PSERDEMFEDAVNVVLETQRGSVSLLQRRLSIGYGRASRLIEEMGAAGILGAHKGSQAREVTITLEEWEAMKAQAMKDAQAKAATPGSDEEPRSAYDDAPFKSDDDWANDDEGVPDEYDDEFKG